MVSHIVSHLAVKGTLAKFGAEFQTKMRVKKYYKRDTDIKRLMRRREKKGKSEIFGRI